MFALKGNKAINRYPLWKYIVLLLVVILGFIYAAPNLYGERPAIQVTGNAPGVAVDEPLQEKIKQLLLQHHITFVGASDNGKFLQFTFKQTGEQLAAKDIIRDSLGDDYTVALSLAPATPNWLRALNAEPMKQGLDLRGGVHFLLDVDVNGVISQRINGDVKNFGEELRNARVRYAGIKRTGNSSIELHFRDSSALTAATSELRRRFPEFMFQKSEQSNQHVLTATMTQDALMRAEQAILEQTMTTLRNRVDELGVSNAMVQQQGAGRVSVDLPGVLDAGRAKQILGGTATLELRLVDDSHDANQYVGSQPPLGTRLYTLRGQPLLLKNEVVLRGSSITNAGASFGEDGRPSVNVRLGGGGEALFSRITRENVGKRLAIVFVETKTENKIVNGQPTKLYHRVERVISAPVIQTGLGSSFEITGLEDPSEANKLALLLRAGALPATIDIAQERTVGPTLGQENINRGLLSIEIGFLCVVVFMAIYYRLLGIFADIALFLNLVLLVALLSVLGNVLTLPGIAGIVLTVGMAVDANVLIFERIREELRNGVSPQASIHAGFERAFATIVDANLTTLIAALALFGIGTGPIKGFAITLTLGILTSMVTAITGTRAMVNLAYGGRNIKSLSIGIKAHTDSGVASSLPLTRK